MLLFELFPAFVLLVSIPIFIWLVAMDRQARRKPPAKRSDRWNC